MMEKSVISFIYDVKTLYHVYDALNDKHDAHLIRNNTIYFF